MRPSYPPPALLVKASLLALVEQGIAALRTAGTLPADADIPAFVVERPKDRTHGDLHLRDVVRRLSLIHI